MYKQVYEICRTGNVNKEKKKKKKGERVKAITYRLIFVIWQVSFILSFPNDPTQPANPFLCV